jgi:glycosyltransferase involved in cell wall biosynthesis
MSSPAQPKVSVVIPSYNHARFLRQRVDSVLTQTFRDFEVILLDDCSTDDSRSIISEYAKDPRVRIEFNEVNSGSTFKQWNKGVRLARGEYIWIAESDDCADEHLLERLVPVLDGEPDVTFAYCRSREVLGDSQLGGFCDADLLESGVDRWTMDFRANGREECRDWFVLTNPAPNASAVVFRRAVYDRVAGADESLRLCGDWKLWAAMAFEGRIAYLAEPLNYHRTHSETVRSKSRDTAIDVKEYLHIVRWVQEQVRPTQAAVEQAYFWTSLLWTPAVLSRRIPFRVRWSLLRDAVATDPHALRRLARPALASVRLKLAKEWRLVRQRLAGRAS